MKETSYSKEIAAFVKNFLSNDDWRYTFDEKSGACRFGLNLSGKIKNISYLIDIKDDSYIVYTYFPIGVDIEDETMTTRMAEFICRANYGLKNGNFELDMRDGEIRYKTFVDCDGVLPTDSIIKTSIYCPAIMLDQYGSGIVDIIFNNISAKEAICKCEKSSDKEFRTLMLSEGSGASEVSDILERLAMHFTDTYFVDPVDTSSTT